MFRKILILLLFLFSFTNCSLLKVNIESETEPLSKDLIFKRKLSQSFVPVFVHEIKTTSDSIINNSKSREIQENALLWKISAIRQIKQKAFQDDPEIAFLDTWLFTLKMNDYFYSGDGINNFKEYQNLVLNTNRNLTLKIDTLAKKAFNKDYTKAKNFVEEYRINNKITKKNFYLESVSNDWYALKKQPDSIINNDVGTLPQVLSHTTTKLTYDTELSLALLSWETELMLKKNKIDSIDIVKISNNINRHIETFMNLLEKSGSELQKDADTFQYEFSNFVDEIGNSLDSISLLAKNEMAIFRDSITSERKAVMKSIDETSIKITDLALKELKTILNDLFIYIIIISVIVLGIPFTIGFIAGKYISKKEK